MKDPRIFSHQILKWYDASRRDLPWRRTRDPYKIWVSEVMLQQTTVAAVIPYYERWMRSFPDIPSVCRSPLPKILKAWQGLGYYQRARNLRNAAHLMAERHKGKVPDDFESLRALPGFGPYTTAAVLSIAFDRRVPLVDANVRRVVMRLLALPGEPTVRQDEKIFRFLGQVLPQKRVGDFNQALMELGATVCRSSAPLCIVCPARKDCHAYRRHLQDVIPGAQPKAIHKIRAVAGIIEKEGRFFMQQRPARGLLAGLWEFPGGRLRKGESCRRALGREISEGPGVSVVAARRLFSVRHACTKFRVTLDVWRCSVTPLPQEDKNHKWLDTKMLKRYPLPSATARIIEKLIGRHRH